MRNRSGAVLLAVLIGMGATVIVATVSTGRAATAVHLTAAGDYGAKTATASVLDRVAQLSPDAHLALGDLSYGDSASESAWCAFVKQRVGEGSPFELIAGNHESLDNPNGEINNFSACLPNQIPGIVGTYGREYYMDFPQANPLVRVIQTGPFLTFSDGRWNYSQGDAHYNWLAAAIDDGRARGAEWIVVTSHYPCLTVGANGCSQPQDFYDLLAAKRVDLVLHGHDHSYARTHQLRSGVPGCATIPARTFNAACVVDSDNTMAAGAGTVFATVGTGGQALRDVNAADSEAGYFGAWSGQNSNPTYGVLDIRITEDILSASFVRAAGGNFTDGFTIDKNAPPPITTTTTTTTSTPTTSSSTTSSSTTSTSSTSSTTTSSSTTSSTSTTVPTTLPGPITLASDSFDRSSASGWGAADVGGPWTVSLATAFSTGGSNGRMSTPTGTSRTAHLRQVSSTATDMLVTLSNDKVATGSGLYISVAPRSIPGAGEYRGVLRTRSDGQLTLRIDQSSVIITPELIVPNIRYTPGMQLDVRVQTVGTSPTRVSAKVWVHGTPEPPAWLVDVTDNASAMQAAGSVGFYVYLSSSATNGPITTSFDQITVTHPS